MAISNLGTVGFGSDLPPSYEDAIGGAAGEDASSGKPIPSAPHCSDVKVAPSAPRLLNKRAVKIVYNGNLPKDAPFVVVSGNFSLTENKKQLLGRFLLEVPPGTGFQTPFTFVESTERLGFTTLSVLTSFFQGKTFAQAKSFNERLERQGWEYSYYAEKERGTMFGVYVKQGERIHKEAVQFYSRLFRYIGKEPRRLELLNETPQEPEESGDSQSKLQTAASIQLNKRYYCTLSVDRQKTAFYSTDEVELSMKCLAEKILGFMKGVNLNLVTKIEVETDTEVSSTSVLIEESEVTPGENWVLWKSPDKVKRKYYCVKDSEIAPEFKDKISTLLKQLPPVYLYY